MKGFSKSIQEALGNYVYGLVDPFTKKIFYVGKANSNNRAFDHLKSSNQENAKIKKINKIRVNGKEPIVEVLRYGLASPEAAFEVEASIIDAIGIENLTNIVRGHGIYVSDTSRKITDDGLKNSSAKILPENSVILSSRAPIGHLAINTKPISTNQGCRGMVPKKNVETLYIYYFLSKSVELLNSLGTGATFKELSNKNLGNITIPLPPLQEQQRIVAILDKAFTAISQLKDNAEQNFKNSRELFESYLQGVFENRGEGWEEKCLDELGIITSSKRIYKSEYVKSGVPFYRTKEIKELSNGNDITLELFISRTKYEEIKKSFGVPQINDLLMSAVGTIGEILVVENDNEFYFKDGNIVWFKEFKRSCYAVI